MNVNINLINYQFKKAYDSVRIKIVKLLIKFGYFYW